MQFHCPSCSEPLRTDDGEIRCATCARSFPELGSIPVLLPDAEAVMQRWRLQARIFLDGVNKGIEAARGELARPDLLRSTRRRIETSCDALADNRGRILTLLAGADIRPADAAENELETGESGSGAGYAGITAYYEQVHRDWGWLEDGEADAENRIAFERVTEAIGDATDLDTVVVLGAGACRLAYDVHHALSPTATVALDINPLLCIVADRLARGEVMSLYEFPLIPRDADSIQVLRHLRAPHGALEGFFVVVGDAFHAPLAAGSVDLVITPWFIDQVPADAREAIGAAHRLLREGGRWVNHGPLIYPKQRAYGVRYTPSELIELVSHSGFRVVEGARRDMDAFLRSPAAGFARIEQVLTFAAIKEGEASSGDDEPPAWLVAPHLPIPRFGGLDAYEAPHPLLKQVADMIDGTTSIADITRRVIHEHSIPTAVAKLGVPAAAAEIARACGLGW